MPVIARELLLERRDILVAAIGNSLGKVLKVRHDCISVPSFGKRPVPTSVAIVATSPVPVCLLDGVLAHSERELLCLPRRIETEKTIGPSHQLAATADVLGLQAIRLADLKVLHSRRPTSGRLAFRVPHPHQIFSAGWRRIPFLVAGSFHKELRHELWHSGDAASRDLL